MDKLWLPEGQHWSLHIEHKQLPDAGAFTGGNWKLVWHTAESDWQSVDSMWAVLRDKDAAPHIVIGGRAGFKNPVAIQCIPFDRAGRALEHPSGTPETNRANLIQVEVCARAAAMAGFDHMAALANLAVLVEHRVPIARKSYHAFRPGAKRLSAAGFSRASSQHIGHMHVPNNDHVDPGALDVRKLFRLMGTAPNEL